MRPSVSLYSNSRATYSLIQLFRLYSTKTSKSSNSGSLTRSSPRAELDTNVKPLGEKVKETTKTASYLGIILLGVGVTGTLFYAIFNELFSSMSPNNVFSAAVKRCLSETRLEDKLGAPISAYGEETRRGRRQHPAYMGFLDNQGKKHLRMKFYLQGAFHKGTCSLEMVENDSGYYEYKYLIVDVNDLAQTRLVLEDSSQKHITTPTSEFLL